MSAGVTPTCPDHGTALARNGNMVYICAVPGCRLHPSALNFRQDIAKAAEILGGLPEEVRDSSSIGEVVRLVQGAARACPPYGS